MSYADRLTLEQEIMSRQIEDDMEGFEEPPEAPEPPASGGMGQSQIAEHAMPFRPHRSGNRPLLRTD